MLSVMLIRPLFGTTFSSYVKYKKFAHPIKKILVKLK